MAPMHLPLGWAGVAADGFLRESGSCRALLTVSTNCRTSGCKDKTSSQEVFPEMRTVLCCSSTEGGGVRGVR